MKHSFYILCIARVCRRLYIILVTITKKITLYTNVYLSCVEICVHKAFAMLSLISLYLFWKIHMCPNLIIDTRYLICGSKIWAKSKYRNWTLEGMKSILKMWTYVSVCVHQRLVYLFIYEFLIHIMTQINKK